MMTRDASIRLRELAATEMRQGWYLERDWLTLLEAAWLLQVREHTARQMVADGVQAHLERSLIPYRGGGARVKVTVESVGRLLQGARARNKLAQLIKGEIVAPRPARRDALPAPLTAGMAQINLSEEVSVTYTTDR